MCVVVTSLYLYADRRFGGRPTALVANNNTSLVRQIQHLLVFTKNEETYDKFGLTLKSEKREIWLGNLIASP